MAISTAVFLYYYPKLELSIIKTFDLITPDIEVKLAGIIKDGKFNVAETKNLQQTNYSFQQIKEISVLGADIVKQHPGYPDNAMIEIETAKGCDRKVCCSFCTEPLKNKFQKRPIEDIVAEMKAFSKLGVKNFRLGKQSDFFAHDVGELKKLFLEINKHVKPEILHIDNVNPANVTEEKVKLTVK